MDHFDMAIKKEKAVKYAGLWCRFRHDKDQDQLILMRTWGFSF